jgi:CRISPR-associated protein Cas6
VSETASERIDLHFTVAGQSVPLDYADALWCGLQALMPALADDPLFGVHPLHGISPGDNVWYLSGRSRLVLRISREQADAVLSALSGQSVNHDGLVLSIGAGMRRELVYSTVIYSKFVTVEPASALQMPIAEDDFLNACRAQCDAMGIRPRLVCGKPQRAQTAEGLLSGFSLMLYDLEREEIRRVQRDGLGLERKRGCGIFIPHKSGASVRDRE